MDRVLEQRSFVVAAGAAMLLAGAAAIAVAPRNTQWAAPAPMLAAAPTVHIAARPIAYPLPGEFLRDGHPVSAPVMTSNPGAFDIMAYQVSTDEYALCVTEGACRPQDRAARALSGHPVTGVSYLDAQAYAAWYSGRTGIDWRLPTDLEWAVAAGESFTEADLSIAYDRANPAAAWLQRYAAEAAGRAGSDPLPKPLGAFGANAAGLYDVAGNVWEWTSTCYVRSTLGVSGARLTSVENCRVHVVEGRHRTYISDFISDAKSGGCGAGTPPDNLGFRLVREPDGIFGLRRLARHLFARWL
jgi:formylglycine-generating enzyme required for sulfatase activity